MDPDTKIWLVIKPSLQSELVDILFETSLRGLELQFKGGLTADSIFGWYLDPVQAKKIAESLVPV
jgi:hypothetical protein